MKGCPIHPNYDCEAWTGKACGLVLDEDCHYDYDQNLKSRKEKLLKENQLWKTKKKNNPKEKPESITQRKSKKMS